jgi:hypothetical protein
MTLAYIRPACTTNPQNHFVVHYVKATGFVDYSGAGLPTKAEGSPKGVRKHVFSDRVRLLKAAGPLPPKFTRKVGHFLKADVSNRGSDTSCLAKCVGPAAASQPTGCDTVRSIEVPRVDVTCCRHHLRLMYAPATYRRFRHHAGQLAARL